MCKAMHTQSMRLLSVIMVTILCMVYLSLPVYAAETDSIDVPLGHWSYAAVESLAQTPLIAKSDVLFDSHTSITRYEMALLVAKILRQLDDLSQEAGNNPTSYTLKSGMEQEVLEELFAAAKLSYLGKGALTDEHLALIKRLVEGFNSELYSLGLIERAARPTDLDVRIDPSSYRLDRVDQIARTDEEDEDAPFRLSGWRSVISSDSTIWRSDGWELEAGISKLLSEAYDPFSSESGRLVTSLEGRLQVAPGVKVSGEYRANPESLSPDNPDPKGDASAMKVGAQMKVGDVEVGASYKSVQPQFDSLIKTGIEGKQTSGYDVSVQYKDVTLSTGRETQKAKDREEAESELVTSLGLMYGVGQDVVLRADYRYVDIDELAEEGVEPSSTRRSTIGVGVVAPKGSVNLGLSYEQEQGKGRLSPTGASADVAHEAWWDPRSVLQAGVALEDIGDDGKKTTSLSLGYNYRKEAALVFGYKVIDFTDTESSSDDDKENIATAELSIRF